MERGSSRSLIMSSGRLVVPHPHRDRDESSSSSLSTWVRHHHHHPDEEIRSRSLYVCSFCRRDFNSAQALGGHMNVHRRDRATLLISSSNLKLPPPPGPSSSSSSSSVTLSNYHHHHHHKPPPNSQPPKAVAATHVSPSGQLLGSAPSPRKANDDQLLDDNVDYPILVFPFSNNSTKPTPAQKDDGGEKLISLELGIGCNQEAIPLPVLDLELRLRCST